MKKYFIFLSIFIHQLCLGTYHSQCRQDKYINEHFFKNCRDGVFVDIGAHNGITYSNTYFFEKELGWSGICIEPMPIRFAELQINRNCICIQGCISNIEGTDQLLLISSPYVNVEMLSGLLHKYDPRHLERVDIEIMRYGGSYQIIDVQCFKLNKILEQSNISHIDFLSIDTEGGEFEILTSIDFSRFTIDVITVENNYSNPLFAAFLDRKGYVLETSLDQDCVFVRTNSRYRD